MKEITYYKNGKKFRKIGRDEVIEEGAMHSIMDGELHSVKFPETIGETPSDFSDDRNFYNPIKE